MDPSGLLDPSRLEEWMRRHNVDPNDPANLDLMERAARAGQGAVAAARRASLEQQGIGGGGEGPGGRVSMDAAVVVAGGHFRLDDHHDQLVFCPRSELDRNQRFRLLKLRRSKVVGELLGGMKMVPASEKELPKGIFDALRKK